MSERNHGAGCCTTSHCVRELVAPELSRATKTSKLVASGRSRMVISNWPNESAVSAAVSAPPVAVTTLIVLRSAGERSTLPETAISVAVVMGGSGWSKLRKRTGSPSVKQAAPETMTTLATARIIPVTLIDRW